MSELTNSPIADFDWDSYEHGQVETGKTREELMKTYDESLKTVKDKEVIEGTVIALNKREAVVNIGYKSDGIIPMSEFRYNPDLKVGDTVEVFIENQEDKKGQLILSHKKARAARSWDRVNEALEQRNHQGLHQVPHKGWYDRRRIRNRGILARFSDRRQANPRLRCIRW